MARLELIAGAAVPAALVLALAMSDTGSERGQVEVLLTRSGAGPAARASGEAPASEAPGYEPSGVEAPGEVPIRVVGSVVLPVARVELRRLPSDPSGGEPGPDAGPRGGERPTWVSVALSGDGTVDLVNLPADGRARIAGGEVPAARYGGVRLVCAGPAAVTLVEDVTLPGAEVLTAGEYELSIPDCETAGLVVPGAAFRVGRDHGAAVSVELRAAAAIRTLVWTGQRFLASPAALAPRAGAARP